MRRQSTKLDATLLALCTQLGDMQAEWQRLSTTALRPVAHAA